MILDEATSSIDYKWITPFKRRSRRSIAHRLKTNNCYDRIHVRDKGDIAEFDTPREVFGREGSGFREMCDKSNIIGDDFKNTT